MGLTIVMAYIVMAYSSHLGLTIVMAYSSHLGLTIVMAYIVMAYSFSGSAGAYRQN